MLVCVSVCVCVGSVCTGVYVLYMYVYVCRFVEPPVLNMPQVVDDSTCRIPLIFVLSTGVVRQHDCVLYYMYLHMCIHVPMHVYVLICVYNLLSTCIHLRVYMYVGSNHCLVATSRAGWNGDSISSTFSGARTSSYCQKNDREWSERGDANPPPQGEAYVPVVDLVKLYSCGVYNYTLSGS